MASTTIEEPVAAIVTTDKCFIRAYHVSDAAAASAAGNHPDISYYMRNTFPYPYTLDNANSWIKHVNEGNPVTNFAIYLLDGTFVGGIGLNPGTDVLSRTWELGYWIGKEFWGRGIMTNAVKGFCRWSFETFPEVARLEAGVFEGNDASMAILKRVGFVMEGVKRSAIFKHGVLLDRHDFGLLRDDTKDSK